MCSQNAGNAILETRILKIIWECPQTPLATVTSCLRYSAHTLGDHLLSWEKGARKMGPLAILPHH